MPRSSWQVIFSTGIQTYLENKTNIHLQCMEQVLIKLDISSMEYYVIIINVMITNNIFIY